MFCDKWNAGEEGVNCIKWTNKAEANAPHEANFLKLDCSKIKKVFGWKPRWGVEEAVEKTVEWSKVYFKSGNIPECMDKQIKDFFDEQKR